MQVSHLPNPRNIGDVDPGSLVLIPDDNGNGNQWAIRTDRTDNKKLFRLNEGRLSNGEIAIADFGTEYRVTIDPTQCRTLPYPSWDGKDPPQGSLCLFSEGKEVCHSILYSHPEPLSLRVFVFEKGKGKTGEMKTLILDEEYGVVFPNWRIEIKAEGEPGGYKWVYKFPANDNE